MNGVATETTSLPEERRERIPQGRIPRGGAIQHERRGSS